MHSTGIAPHEKQIVTYTISIFMIVHENPKERKQITNTEIYIPEYQKNKHCKFNLGIKAYPTQALVMCFWAIHLIRNMMGIYGDTKSKELHMIKDTESQTV